MQICNEVTKFSKTNKKGCALSYMIMRERDIYEASIAMVKEERVL